MVLPFSFQKEHKRTGCEDAPPVSTPEYAIVCDGLGGAGLTRHTLPPQELGDEPIVRTSAYLGSRVVCNCVEAYYARNSSELMKSLADSELTEEKILTFLNGLKVSLVETMGTQMEDYGIQPQKGKSLKIFPTTLASFVCYEKEETIFVLVIWAGDSRVYYLSPEKGLQLLSMDDARGAADTMGSASEMTNCISAGNTFTLNYALYELPKPGIIFCCSDGCFDYIPSPLQLEWGILYSILNELPKMTGNDFITNFAAAIRDTVYSDIGDDTTMAGMLCDIESSEEIGKLYGTRMKWLEPETEKIVGALQAVRAGYQERTAARKICLRYEDRIIAVLKEATCEALLRGVPKVLVNVLSGLPEYVTFCENVSSINQQLEQEEQRQLKELENRLKPLKERCKKLLILDKYTQLRMKKKSMKSILEPISQAVPDYSCSSAQLMIHACIKLIEHSEFNKQVSHAGIPEADWEKNLQSKTDALKYMLQVLKENDPFVVDMWEQSVSAVLMSESSKFATTEYGEKLWQKVLHDSDYDIPCSLTRKCIEEYKYLKKLGIPTAQERSANKAVKMRSAAEYFFSACQEAIMDAAFATNAPPLDYLEHYGDVSATEVNAFADARIAVAQLDEKIQTAQNTITEIWEKYRGDYQLFCTEIEKGAI